ncbi:endonuclease domain-containing protein [Aestuariimicrobium soli]|uniref:endonuclease domain-containing protein n=1 Tax=Aestuariimicrobium soli TaxID=2035834 RepID=UPI003EC013F4
MAATTPSAVFTHDVAAWLAWWPELDVSTVSVAGSRMQADWLTRNQCTIDRDWVIHRRGLVVTHPARSVLELTETRGADPIDEALRRRATTLAHLRTALASFPVRGRGRAEKAAWLLDSRDEPWSALERRAHRMLRAACITGWKANLRIRTARATFYADIAFPSLRLVIELDGFTHHSTAAQLSADHERQNDLQLAGWTVLRFTWTTVDALVESVRAFAMTQK